MRRDGGEQPRFAPQRGAGFLAFWELEDQAAVRLDREAVPALAGDRERRAGKLGMGRNDSPAQMRRDVLRNRWTDQ
ncbi:MAG: hypothetical protein M9895_19445 [Aquamicrobium sp.]|uniref:hypothetical protein n=1 Tax=Aquamicrobium sp. TaxID=1872579 RepID=UPI00349E7FEB|nr:hypothetical protein [Aquamicrobium sp.]